ncbi:alpha/beta hydrolase [Neisseria chenwenguii]|nr:alpha/beta hydrolase [Neisseria chenwenguii]
MNRRLFIQTLTAAFTAAALSTAAAPVLSQQTQGANRMTHAQNPTLPVSMVQEWDKIFPQNSNVSHQKVSFKNRYGITLVGDLYLPKNASGKLPAIAVSGPFGAVKEQSSGLYAQELAARGFVTLAFDGSYTGESGGEPRNMASPEINTEDFSAAVDYLGRLKNVNRENIGILGVCGWGGFALNAAVSDPRIKAVAVSTMYDMTRVNANGYEIKLDPKGQYDRVPAQDADARYKMKLDMSNARWEAAKHDYADLLPANNLDPEKDITAETPKFVAEYANFYRTKRGFHPRSVNSNPKGSWTTTAFLPFINMPILQRASELRAPALVVHGEIAHSRYFGEDAFKSLGSKDKELVIVKGANHTDLYDNTTGKIPFDKFEAFFKAKLK